MDSVNSAVNSATSNVAKKAIKITDDITSSIPPPQKVYSLEASNTGYSTPFKVFVVVCLMLVFLFCQKMVEAAVLKGGRPLKVPKQMCLNKIRCLNKYTKCA